VLRSRQIPGTLGGVGGVGGCLAAGWPGPVGVVRGGRAVVRPLFKWGAALLAALSGTCYVGGFDMADVGLFRRAWGGEEVGAGAGAPEWPRAGLAIEGDFSGIQQFVLRPVPGAGGAARRLRARSFRVLALTRLVARAIEGEFSDAGARLYYSAGGRFLVVGRSSRGWEERLGALQAAIDEDLMGQFRGSLVFHLAGAEFGDGRVPRVALGESLGRRKLRPLIGALQGAEGWASGRFAFLSSEGGRCDGCGTSDRVRAEGGERLCEGCVADREIGARLLGSGQSGLAEREGGRILLLGRAWDLTDGGSLPVPLIGHAPRTEGRLATFEELAGRAIGRSYLGYLRVDADRIGAAFRELENDPRRIWGLSRLLDHAFSGAVDGLLSSRFRNIYPVYGGGDDLFVIGPWQETLEFAGAFRKEFRAMTGDKLTFSAGLALAKKRQHILTKSEEAEEALNGHAKEARDSIHALGATMSWPEYERAFEFAGKLAGFHAKRAVRSAMLNDILELHARWQAGDQRWRSLLFYQIERNLKEAREAQDALRRAFLTPGDLWKHADFAARYAMLASGGEGGE
jgi:CRISPR-associated protein Csm1